MTATLLPAPAIQESFAVRTLHLKHLRGPRPGVALCGAQVKGIPARPSSSECIVCTDIALGRPSSSR